MYRFFIGLAVFLSAALFLHGADEPGVRKLHFIQDDAQDYMVSKIYTLKYVQSNDIAPFLLGIVKRYNINSVVSNIEYGSNNTQLVTVTCPVKMMPYVDDFIAKVDRDVKIDGKVPGDIVKGSGITRAVYRPRYRSGQNLLNVLVNSVIGEGTYGSVYAWDQNSNQIYWKDNSSNVSYVYQFLDFLDRPPPQITFNFTLYEVRESEMRDLGIDFLAWKNGPGLNIFQTAWDVFSLSSGGSAALAAASGPVGGFLTAPMFDASFIRMLAQGGHAAVSNSASMTVSNSDSRSYSIYFNPQMQNIVKNDNDKTSVVPGLTDLPEGYYQVCLKINQPIANIHYGHSQTGYPASEAFAVNNYLPGTYSGYKGTVLFGYEVQTANVVERNNSGEELVETSGLNGNVQIKLGREVILGQWERNQKVTQRIGAPWLMNIPVLGYIFSTETVSREKSHVYLTCRAEMLDTAAGKGIKTGELIQIK